MAASRQHHHYHHTLAGDRQPDRNRVLAILTTHQQIQRQSLVLCCALFVVLGVFGCSGPNDPEPEGPAAVISIDTVTVTPGSSIPVNVRIEYPDAGYERLDSIGAFWFTIEFDDTIISAIDSIMRGESISNWASFAGNVDTHSRCEECPGEIRLHGVRRHSYRDSLSNSQAFPEGTIATLYFKPIHPFEPLNVTTPIWFRSNGCVSCVLRRSDDLNDMYVANTNYPGCEQRALYDTIRCPRIMKFEPILSFHSGAVTISELDGVIQPGDINGDGTPFTSEDMNAFIDVFPYSYQEPLTRSDSLRLFVGDCNRDGESYTLADLDFLISVTFGFTQASDTLRPVNADTLYLSYMVRGDTLTIVSHATVPVGALWMELISDWEQELDVSWLGEDLASFSSKIYAYNLRLISTTYRGNVTRILDSKQSAAIRIISPGVTSFAIRDVQASAKPGVSMVVKEIEPPLPGTVVSLGSTTASVGSDLSIPVTLANEIGMPVKSIRGFDFLIHHDRAILTHRETTRGPAIDGWEYFTWRIGGPNTVRIASITDMNNGLTPPPQSFNVDGDIAFLHFTVADDEQIDGTSTRVEFIQVDCGDNVISSKDRNTLYTPNLELGDAIIYDGFDQSTCEVRDAREERVIILQGGVIEITDRPGR